MTELNRENLCMGERSVPVFSQAYCETDVIVPDVNPDISKVLQVSTNACITNKSCSEGRMNFEGRADIIILYLGDDGGVYSIPVSQQFSHIADAPNAKEGMFADAEINVDNTDYTILNTRKLNVKVLMGIDANGVEDVYADLCTDILADEQFEVLNKTLNPYKTVCRTTEQLCIKERLEIPAGKPSIHRILRADSCLRDKTFSLTVNKMMVQATLYVDIVYLSDIDGKIHTTEYEIPFTEIIPMADVDESMNANLKLCITKLYYKPEEDADGDNRYIMIECLINASAKAYKGYSFNLVQDAYSIDHPLEIVKNSAEFCKLIDENKSQFSVKDVVIIPNDKPEIMQIFNITPKAFLGTAKADGKEAIVEGVIECDIMYVSPQQSHPITTYSHQIQFSHKIPLANTAQNMICDVDLEIVHSSYSISMGREVDIRFVIEVNNRIMSAENIEFITDIKDCPDKNYTPNKSYCIKIYFAKKDDNLWNISKKHRVRKEALMEINNISNDNEIFEGRQLMIPIK